MNDLMKMALEESLELTSSVISRTYRTKNELNSIYNKYQEDIRTISLLISMAHDAKNTSGNKADMVVALEKLMLSKQKDVNELSKVIELTTENAIDLEKSKKWIKTITETP